MDVVCFSFDCTFNDDGSSNCTTIDPRYTKTTTYKPTFKPTRQTATNSTTAKPPPTEPITTPKATAKPTTAKPSPTKPITTPKTTAKPTTAKPSPTEPTTVPLSSQKSSVATHTSYQTTDVIYTTTNIRTSSLPMGHKVTSPGTPAVGPSVYIPCSVVGFVVVVVLLASIAIVRRYRNRRRSSEARRLLEADSMGDLIDETPPSTVPTVLSPNGDPMFQDVSLTDESDDTDETEVERLDLIEFSSKDSYDLEKAAPVHTDNIIFDISTVRTQRERNVNEDNVV
ncbi:salivary glue protein Sgs-3-like isoform X2 [Pecten maximus]|uniref:salivary glue protein Sgs-3-like isoform X2 n=1 Tax=Pecten maximus TaxID=6579 RepID=UPI001457ECB1|nr:salivary glue protein Sgs-3-like isoform X2 [Pecten maximus]